MKASEMSSRKWEITKKAPLMEMEEEINKQWKIQNPVGVLDDRWNYYSSNEMWKESILLPSNTTDENLFLPC